MKNSYRSIKKCFFISVLSIFSLCFSEENPTNPLPLANAFEEIFKQGVVVDLRSPLLKNGVLSTNKGGVVTAPGIRIQAKNITYTKNASSFKVEAYEDLMVEYGDRVFIGKHIEYDFNLNSGTITEGTTSIDPWFIGGALVRLKPNGEYQIEDGYITTCENIDSEWQVSAKNVLVPKDNKITANNIQVRFLNLPLFWLPSFKGNIKKFLRAPVRWQVHWGGARGTRLTMRYRFLSKKQLNAYMRIDYRLSRGFGMGIETNYLSKSQKTSFLTRNYLAYDISSSDPKKHRRYRFEGQYNKSFQDDRTSLDIKYDKLSDSEMPSDFDDSDFHLETAQRTEFLLRRREDPWILSLITRARINSFQSLRQETPTLEWRIKPFNIAETGILSDNNFKASYLSFEHAKHIDRSRNFESSRFQSQNFLYRPFKSKYGTFTPKAGIICSYYDKSPLDTPSGTLLSITGGEINVPLHQTRGKKKHIITPYLTYDYYKNFKNNVEEHYIFDFDDSWSSLNMMRLGFKNSLYEKKEHEIHPVLDLDIYANAFFQTKTFPRKIPKIYADLSFSKFQNLAFKADGAWNFDQKKVDRYNLLARWTKNEDFALSAEYRSREAFDWRKADKQNFFLESFRNENVLANSTLSDKRATVLGNLYCRLSHNLVAHIQSRHGYKRADAPKYNEFQLDILTSIRCGWRLKLSFQNTESDNRVSFHVRLNEGEIKKPESIPLIWP